MKRKILEEAGNVSVLIDILENLEGIEFRSDKQRIFVKIKNRTPNEFCKPISELEGSLRSFKGSLYRSLEKLGVGI